jgi:spermidine/putrescine-binding protein
MSNATPDPGGTLRTEGQTPDQLFLSDPFDRRKLLQRAGLTLGALGAGGLLSACGGNASSGASSGKLGGQLDMYTWEGYDLPKEMAAWKKQHGVTVKSSYIGVASDPESKIKSPAGRGIDLSVANQAFLGYWSQLGILSKITEEEVPTLAKMYPAFQKAPWRNEDGTYNSVPWNWGVLGLTYAPDRIDEPKTWDVMFDPAMKGRVAAFDDGKQNVQLAAVILGYDPTQLTQPQLEEIKKWLVRLVKQLKTFTPTTGDQVSLLASGEVDLVFLGWIGIDALIKDKGGKAKTVVPQGGALGYCDSLFIPPTADNRTTALAWCEESLKGKVAAQAANALYAGVPNPEVVPLLDPQVQKIVPYDNVEKFISDEIVLPLGYPVKSDKFVTGDQALKAWEEVKAAAA